VVVVRSLNTAVALDGVADVAADSCSGARPLSYSVCEPSVVSSNRLMGPRTAARLRGSRLKSNLLNKMLQ
jgi:hypothetical protein